MANPCIGHGSTITFATSGFTASIRSFNPASMSRDAIDDSHAGTTGKFRTFCAGMIDMGELTIDIIFDPDTDPPIDGAAETITITFPTPSGQSTPADWEFTGFMTAYNPTVPFDGLLTASVTVKISGDITYTASA